MISNLRISVAELVVWALLAAAGLTWLLLGIGRSLERAWAWWRDRRPDEDISEEDDGVSEDCANGDHGECEGCWCDCGHDILPPERTWEQMTSHQLPIGPSRKIRDWLERDDPAEDDGPDGCVVPSSPESASAALAMRTGIGTLTAARERRAPWWEAEHRAAYESLGFDYPSGLMARVRELTP